ncbi:putative CDP-alcohol phosphatidyltransferase class-I family protein C22A12.08c [Pseudocercospora fuligena]|uniref:Putative CDP-alcohol phosphatidyltransferase class-I family protein C22A12.08c n=1 Tax=Pseudocercospora fuligena TaxID=685502 RepID=A0A8H6R8A7_9PEZI|nr:putative CDP-alcohol phosphatidyltransferase class-I family protein C22A12.08c [Pseudocercospora fuligena]
MARTFIQHLRVNIQHVNPTGKVSAASCQLSGAVPLVPRFSQGRALYTRNRSACGQNAQLQHCTPWPILRRPASLPTSTRLRLLSEDSQDKQPASGQANADPPSSQSSHSTPKQPITQSLKVARERTKAVGNKVRSSLTSLTPHENIYNLPNFLTVTRLFAAPATAYLFLHDQYAWALGLFAYAGITDLVDGWMARKWKLQTVAGSVIDPMADKALMIILTVTLAVKGAIPLYLATLILGRDASLAVAAIYYRYASLPAPKTLLRYWDFSLPSAEVHPTTVSKYNTFLQLILIGSTLALPVITAGHYETGILQSLGLNTDQLHSAMRYFQCLVAATTAWSGLSYAYLKNVVTILGSNEELKGLEAEPLLE